MSAWLCSQDHLNLIVNSARHLTVDHWSQFGMPRADIFAMLLEENLRSLRHRYEDCSFLQEWEDRAKTYRFEDIAAIDLVTRVYAETRKNDPHIAKCYPATLKERVAPALVAAQVVHCCSSYDYQSCEHPGWKTSDAKAFVDAVEAKHTNRNTEKARAGCLWAF